MEAHESNFLFLGIAQDFYEVPFFQRGYVWQEKNWEDLWKDLIDDNSNHFLGSIIVRDNEGEDAYAYSIIDGQQRITTISILLRICYEVLIQNESPEKVSVYGSQIGNLIYHATFDEFDKPILKPVIKHSIVDAPNYERVILHGLTDEELLDITLDSEMEKEKNQKHIGVSTDNNILKCYKFFKKKVCNKAVADQITKLFTNKKNKMIVRIDLDSTENEQAIFDTINTAGVRLSCADTIKNSIFQKAMENAKTDSERNYIKEFYTNQWEKMFAANEEDIKYWNTEIQVGRYKRNNLEILFQSIALIYKIYDPEQDPLYKLTDNYKDYLKKQIEKCNKEKLNPVDNILGFVREIVDYANIYKTFFYPLNESSSYIYGDALKRLFNILNAASISSLHPYILKLLKEADIKEGEPLSANLKKKLYEIEVYVVRSLICGSSVSNFNKECPILIRGEKSVQDYIEEKKLTDAAVELGLKSIKNNSTGRIVLFWLELYKQESDHKEDNKALFYLNYTLEHIMPVTWDKYWKIKDVPVYDTDTFKKVKDEDEAIEMRNRAVYEIGNMALLSGPLNSSISNFEIERKMNGAPNAKLKDKTGIKDHAHLMTTREVVDEYEKNKYWDERIISQRTRELSKNIIKIWAL